MKAIQTQIWKKQKLSENNFQKMEAVCQNSFCKIFSATNNFEANPSIFKMMAKLKNKKQLVYVKK
jgi:hypothetical protein